jgi:hypothetical protein
VLRVDFGEFYLIVRVMWSHRVRFCKKNGRNRGILGCFRGFCDFPQDFFFFFFVEEPQTRLTKVYR